MGIDIIEKMNWQIIIIIIIIIIIKTDNSKEPTDIFLVLHLWLLTPATSQLYPLYFDLDPVFLHVNMTSHAVPIFSNLGNVKNPCQKSRQTQLDPLFQQEISELWNLTRYSYSLQTRKSLSWYEGATLYVPGYWPLIWALVRHKRSLVSHSHHFLPSTFLVPSVSTIHHFLVSTLRLYILTFDPH